jgi:acetyltransferase-like isoleucine patch superfamily enzyme
MSALHPRVLARATLQVARRVGQAGMKQALYPHVRFGPRCSVDSRCKFEEGVTIGPDSTLMATSMGRQTYCAFRLWAANTRFGRFCAIGPGVIAGIGRHPSRDFASTHPAFFSPSWPAERRYAVHEFDEHPRVEIGSDVWIGANAFIGAGITIGDGAIIGAGAVVTKDVEPYSVVVGVPGRVLRQRFPPSQQRALSSIEWWNWSDEQLRSAGPLFCDISRLLRLSAPDGDQQEIEGSRS